MHNFQDQCETVFRATECLSLFSWKQCLIKQLLDWVFVMSGVIEVEVLLSVIEAEEIMFIIRWKWTPSCFHTDGLCDGKCISCLRTAILCRVVQRIYRAFGISHCIYMYRYSECVFMVQCGKSNMIWKRFYGATRSVWCDCVFITDGLGFEIILLYTGS